MTAVLGALIRIGVCPLVGRETAPHRAAVRQASTLCASAVPALLAVGALPDRTSQDSASSGGELPSIARISGAFPSGTRCDPRPPRRATAARFLKGQFFRLRPSAGPKVDRHTSCRRSSARSWNRRDPQPPRRATATRPQDLRDLLFFQELLDGSHRTEQTVRPVTHGAVEMRQRTFDRVVLTHGARRPWPGRRDTDDRAPLRLAAPRPRGHGGADGFGPGRGHGRREAAGASRRAQQEAQVHAVGSICIPHRATGSPPRRLRSVTGVSTSRSARRGRLPRAPCCSDGQNAAVHRHMAASGE